MLSIPLRSAACLALLCSFACAARAQSPSPALPGNPTHIDFSYAGYAANSAPIPSPRATLLVRPTGHDDTRLLQAALDKLASTASAAHPSALRLAPGTFHVSGQLRLAAPGLILRGSGPGLTTILATGVDRRSLVLVGTQTAPSTDKPIAVTADAPAGALSLTLADASTLHPGDHIVITRPSTQEWISALGMSGLPGTFANQRLDWHPGSHDLTWDRTLTAVSGNTITLDAPITFALTQPYGLGTVALTTGNPTPSNIGIEDLTLVSAADTSVNPKSEDHSWIAVQLDTVENAWVRRVTTRGFVASAVRANWRAGAVTIDHVRYESPISELGGYRRQSFVINGQQILVRNSYSESGTDDFASGLLAAGPNVFLDCTAHAALGPSGSFEGMSTGVLYERVHIQGQRLALVYDFSRAQGAGWTAANSLIHNSTATSLDALGPPGAPNFVSTATAPLFEAELHARLPNLTQTSGAPSVPAAPSRGRVGSTTTARTLEFRPADIPAIESGPSKIKQVTITNGRFTLNDATLWGSSQTEAWWRGDTSPATAMGTTGSSVSRFMPGVTAPGETEDLAAMADRLKTRGLVSYAVNPGLWYEHRRDAHNDERRPDGDVWAPFYEMPWARSGRGIAWDGLSLFDVGRYNPWYFARHREFATEAAKQGFLVFYDLYNTHNVLEIGPHYIDFPWRPANNINNTGIPEPPPLAPHNRNDIANEFYSTANPSLRALHRAYMLHTFDVLGDQPNVLFGMAYQYAGPLAFQQFLLDTGREWESTHPGQHLRFVLTADKATTDAILADPVRSKQIAVVDMRYWQYRPDGSLWAPRAGENHAFRELIAKEFPGYTDTPPFTTPQQVYRQVREYRDRFPQIAFMPMESGAGPITLLMAGAASPSALVGRPPAPPPTPEQQAAAMYPQGNRTQQQFQNENRPNADRILETFVREHLSSTLPHLTPQDGWTQTPESTWTLAGTAADPVLFYSLAGAAITLSHPLPAAHYTALWFSPASGKTEPATFSPNLIHFAKPDSQPWLLLLTPQP